MSAKLTLKLSLEKADSLAFILQYALGKGIEDDEKATAEELLELLYPLPTITPTARRRSRKIEPYRPRGKEDDDDPDPEKIPF